MAARGPDHGHGKRKHVDRGRGFVRVDDKHVDVYDIDFAAWLLLSGLGISEAYKNGREAVVTFYDPKEEDRVDKLAVDFLNSESARFANAVRQIKKICFSTGKKNRRGG